MHVATLRVGGFPHLVTLWFALVDGRPAFTTYRRSQKVHNLMRDPRMTCLVETGGSYDDLRGVQLSGHGQIVDNREQVDAIGDAVHDRVLSFGKGATRSGGKVDRSKRVAIIVDVESAVTWDHRKLSGR